MSDSKIEGYQFKPGFKGMAEDTASDQTMFKGVHWGKAMMWIFLLSDTFVFSCFLISYMKGRGSTPVEWPNASEVFGLHCDFEFNHPETEINIILPITDMYDTNSIYFNNIENSLNYKDYNNLNINKNQIYLGYFNKINHYNRINKTNKTRVSFDFRIILKSMYLDSDKTSATSKTKFKIGEYYSII